MRTGLALLALALACALTTALPASAARAPVKGPKGDAFYKPPKKLPGKRHGDLIWARSQGKPGLKKASSDTLVLYRSKAYSGDPIAVSGFVMTPKGKPPKGGWPLMTFGHGTAGIADQCAPSKTKVTRKNYLAKLWNGYLKAGYAVAQSDYEGLGTPGDHPYLIGQSEGRSVLDIARAARKLDKRIGKRVLVSGHSQGGHAVLWAAGEAKRWTPELKLLGVHAFAPIASASPLAAAAEAFTEPGGLSAYAGLITRAFDATLPDYDPADFITPAALELYPDTRTKCLGDLFAADSFGGISVADIVRDDVNTELFVGLFRVYVDVNELKLPPVLLMHGTADGTIPIALSDGLAADLDEAGTKLKYKKYEGASHSSVVSEGTKAALADAKKRLK